MPLYDYRCRVCGKTFEMLRRVQNADKELQCPHCQSNEVERLLSKFVTRGCGSFPSTGFG